MSLRRFRIGGMGPGGDRLTPIFRALGNGSIVPTIGTAGSFARGSSKFYPSSYVTAALASSGSPCIPAFAPGLNSPSGGVYISGALTNLLLQSNGFGTTWTLNGTASRVADALTSPNGAVTAYQLDGLLTNDGIQQASASAAGSNTWVFGVWLKTNSGSDKSVSLILKDQAGSPQSFTQVCTVNSTWQFFRVSGDFVAATGNVVCEIKVGNTTGYHVYAWEAVLHSVDSSTTNGLQVDYDLLQNITTTTAVASVVADDLSYAGAEVKALRSVWAWNTWAYVPNFTDAELWANKHIFVNYNSVSGARQGARINTTNAKLHVCWGENSWTDSTIFLSKGAWNMITVVGDHTGSGSYQCYVNSNPGASFTGITRTASATNALVIGGDRIGPGASQQFMWNSIVGQTELYGNTLTQGEVTTIYNQQHPAYSPIA